MRHRRVQWRRLLAAGLLAACAAGLIGGGMELWRFGPSDASAAARVDRFVRTDFDRMTNALSRAAGHVTQDARAAQGLAAGPDAARSLFDLAAAARASVSYVGDVALTIYASTGDARAWAGRPSDILPERVNERSAFFVTPSPLGVRLVYVQAIAGSDGRQLGSVAAEHVLSPAPAAAITVADYRLSTPLAPVSLRMWFEGAGDQVRRGAFLLSAPSGEPLAEAMVSADDLRQARAEWRERVVATVLGLCGATLLLLIGPLLDRRAAARESGTVVRTTAGAAALLAAGSWMLWLALSRATAGAPGTPAALLLGGATAAAMTALLVVPAARFRLAMRHRRRAPGSVPLRFVAHQAAAGVLVTALIILFARVLNDAVDPASIDLRHFSLHPWTGAPARLTLLTGILSLHVALLWAGSLLLHAALARWRVPRRSGLPRFAAFTLWLAPAIAGAALSAARGWPVPAVGLVASAAACGAAALAAPRVAVWYRHTTVAARILALFVAFLVPALLLYPSMDFFAERATERLVTTQYAVEALSHPQALQDRMAEALREIDALTILPDLVTGAPGVPLTAPRSDSAFLVWNQTVLARARLTSAVELYDIGGALVSRFALNFPEYTGSAQTLESASACDWELFGEVAPFGSEERRLLHAQRNICTAGSGGTPATVGSIIVHVVFDYRTLPFITSQSPYFEVFRPSEAGAPREGMPGRDVEVVIYGWGLGPVYTSGGAAWPITDQLFTRLYASRDPFWTVVRRGDKRYRVYFSNDRVGIYAVGYPELTRFDHLVHLAELTTLAGASFVVVLLGTALFTRVARERPRVGRALLREIRASFYRKLFLAFVLASIIPVLTLALVIRAYFANQLLRGIEADAARTAAVAQRVIGESDDLQRSNSDVFAPGSDDLMVWISQVIDQDVNIFAGPQLTATSERDLFASGLLPTRTPDSVYRAIVLDRLPSFVGEDRIGTFPYLIAAAPVRAGGRDAILTVPLTLRQREIDREIDDLDRGVHLAALFFILLGAGIGLYMAERIADPIRRLTQATRRIARGDFDAQIAVKSADELKRLVDAFNSMARELKAQRGQLERTHRLEAWAEMARQVAHEIKNPLTPIQLSAEHLRRVHADSGQPMGDVLENCVTTILGQVRLLRQISAEFSSFASSPTAKRSPIDLPELIAAVIDPYRAGLAGRISIVNGATPPLPRALADRTLIARALSNIVENALHAMPSSGELVIDARVEADWVVLEVRDTGVGMDEEALARVFEPYFSTKTTGTGLGLPIARRNVELSGGSIEVESTPGRGTLVRLRLPMAE